MLFCLWDDIFCSSQCSTTGVTNAMVYVILSVGHIKEPILHCSFIHFKADNELQCVNL